MNFLIHVCLGSSTTYGFIAYNHIIWELFKTVGHVTKVYGISVKKMERKYRLFLIPFNDCKIYIFCKVHYLHKHLSPQNLFTLNIFKRVFSRVEMISLGLTPTSFHCFWLETLFYGVHWAQNALEIQNFNGFSFTISGEYNVLLPTFYVIDKKN